MIAIPKPALCLVAMVLSSPCFASGVITVGASGAAYTNIGSAVAASVDGDVLLVRAGFYPGFTVDAKAISIVADSGATVTVWGPSTVKNLPEDKTFVLKGISILNADGDSALTLSNNDGHVRIEALVAKAGPNNLGGTWYAVNVSNCTDASFVGCTLKGRAGEYGGLGYGHGGDPALNSTSSTITLYDCRVIGGTGLYGHYGSTALPVAGSPGAPSLYGVNTILFAHASSFIGGTGGAGLSLSQCPDGYHWTTSGGEGGAGLSITGASSSGQLVACTTIGGVGGLSGTHPCGGGQATQAPSGPPMFDPQNVVTQQSGPALALAVSEPAREGQSVALHFTGPQGYHAYLATGLGGAGYLVVPSLQGVLLVAPALRRLSLGTMPASGVLDVNLPVPDLGVGVGAQVMHTQAIFVDPNGVSLLASPSVIVMLDSSY